MLQYQHIYETIAEYKEEPKSPKDLHLCSIVGLMY